MVKLWPTCAGSPSASRPALRMMVMLGLVSGVIGCASPQLPRVTASGTLPIGIDAGFVMTEAAAAETLLSAAAVTRCLDSKGLKSSAAAQLLVQYSVAVRPESSSLQIGAQAASAAATSIGRAKGERIIYHLIIDRLNDEKRLYALTIDADYKPRRSSAASRAAQFCAAVGSKVDQPASR